MKKNIMIEIINESIKEWHQLYRGNQEGYTVSHHILARIEQFGHLSEVQHPTFQHTDMNESFVLMVEENPVPTTYESEEQDD